MNMAWSLLLLKVNELDFPEEMLSWWVWPLEGGVSVDLLGEGPPFLAKFRNRSVVKLF